MTDKPLSLFLRNVNKALARAKTSLLVKEL